MRFIPTLCIALALPMLPLAGLAGFDASCASGGSAAPVQIGNADDVAASAHEHGDIDADAHHRHDTTTNDCSCCGGCAFACLYSGGQLMSETRDAPGPEAATSGSRHAAAGSAHTAPFSPALFRPPIAS